MQTGGHQVVHQVVARGDLVEHIVHLRLLLAERNGGEAEMRGFAGLLAHGPVLARAG